MSKGSGASRRQRSRQFVGSYSEAKAALVRFQVECGEMPEADAVTFRDYSAGWIERRKGQMAESTRRKYRDNMACWWPLIGDVPLQALDRAKVDVAVAAMRDGAMPSGRPPKDSYLHALMVSAYTICKGAVQDGLMERNPLEGAAWPNVRYAPKDPPSAAQVSALLASLDCADGRQMAVYLCASMGLRIGEALALDWSDFDGGICRVRKSVDRMGNVTPTKTDAGMRDLPVPSHVLSALEVRRASQEAEAADLASVGLSSPQGHICGCNYQMVAKWWERERAGFGLSCTLHGLRHAYLTALAVEGVHPNVMQQMAGHSSPITTLRIYTHANMDARKAAVDAVASVLHP